MSMEVKRPQTMAELLEACRGCKGFKYLKTVAENEGVLTHQLNEIHGIKGNNHHQMDCQLRPTLDRFGWELVKRPVTSHRESWGWYLQKKECAQMQEQRDA